mgnify:FL=1
MPDSEWLAQWAKETGKPADLAAVHDDPALRGALDEAVARVNRRLSGIERVRRFRIAREPFSIENEQMTPTLKVRRHMLCAAYGDALDNLYHKG